MQRVIILRGAPASGKTTIAKSYRNFENKTAWLKVDTFKDFFADDSSVALPYVNGSAIATLKYLLTEGFSVVMDGVFQETNTLDNAVKIARDIHVPIKVFELEVSLETLQKRDLVREGVPEGMRPPLGDDLIEAIYSKLQATHYSGSIKLNTETNSLEKCKEIIDSNF